MHFSSLSAKRDRNNNNKIDCKKYGRVCDKEINNFLLKFDKIDILLVSGFLIIIIKEFLHIFVIIIMLIYR